MKSVWYYRDPDLPYFELKISRDGDISYKKHSHEEYSIGIVKKGSSSFWHEGRIHTVGPKTMVLIPPRMVHSCNPQKEEQWKYKMLFINAAWMRDFFRSKFIPEINYPIVSDIPDSEEIIRLDGLIAGLTVPVGPLEKEARLISFLEEVLGGVRWGGVRWGGDLSVEKEPSKLKIVQEYLCSHFLEKISLDQLEQVSGLNKFSLIRTFKEEYSIPPHTYQTLLRINFAKTELRKNRKIVEVAHETGFYDQSHFSKVFKSHIGVSPERYQKPN